MNNSFVIKNLESSVGGKEILKGVSLEIMPSEIHAVMGPNGAGKTTLVMSLMGNPNYKFRIQNSEFRINGGNEFDGQPELQVQNSEFRIQN